MSYFLPDLDKIDNGEFSSPVPEHVGQPLKLLAMQGIYAKGNMSNISETIPINISRDPSGMENMFIGKNYTHEEIS